jgi:streptomycin 6-kinase
LAHAPELPLLPIEWPIRSADLLAEGVGGRVWRVTLADGQMAALKQASAAAAREEAVSGNDFLQWRSGSGAVQLLARADNFSLLEWAGAVRLGDHLIQHGDEEAARIAGDVIRRIHSPGAHPAPASLIPLDTWFGSLFRTARSAVNSADGRHFAETAKLAGRLLARQRDVKPLHGDVHHDNILFGSRGWLAIDPKGLIGDPAYDVANIFQNPVGYAKRSDPQRILLMAGTMAEAIDRDVETVLEYAFAYSGLSAAWFLEAGDRDAADSTLEIGRAIGSVLAQVRS